jgi:iron complex transport system substrate-binding protein
MRIVSLVPSATESLFAAGGGGLLVGRSHDCTWPPEAMAAPVLTQPRTTLATPADIDTQVRDAMDTHGSLYELDTTLLANLKPDLILTQDICNVCSIDRTSIDAAIAMLDSQPQVLSLNPHSFEDVLDDVLRIGEAIGKGDFARRAMVDLRAVWWDTQDAVNPYVDGPATVVLEWTDPLWIAGHWTPSIIAAAGGHQRLVEPGQPSRIVQGEDLLAMQVERLIIAPCGVCIDDAQPHIDALRQTNWWNMLPAVQEGHVALVDGTSSFSRPGPRLVHCLQWLTSWLQARPGLQPPDFRWSIVPPSECQQ